MRPIRTFISVFVVSTIIASVMLSIVLYDNVSAADEPVGDGTPGDPFMVRDADELSKVGKGTANIETEYQVWTLDKSYKLANDIVFGDGDDKNGGIDIGIVVTYNEAVDEFSVELTPDTGNITSLYVWIGEKNSVSVSPNFNEATVDVPNNPGTYTMTVGGTHTEEGGTFAYAIEIDTTDPNNGTVATDVFNSNGNFTPIGDATEPFTGTFDGAGFKISGMNVAVFSSSSVYGGMFGYISGASITDLGVTNGHSVVVSMSYAYAGGIAGYVDENVTFTNCYNTSDVTATSVNIGADAGGVTSECYSQITNCYNIGNVTATSVNGSTYAAGIASYMYVFPGMTEKCYNAGNVTSISSSTLSANAAGITTSTSAEIMNCYNTGNINALSTGSDTQTYAGGIVSITTSAAADVINCYNTGYVTVSSLSSDSGAGGIIVHMGSASIMNSYFLNGTASDLFVSGNPYDITDSGSRSDGSMRDRGNYTEWDFDNVWGIDPELNNGFPVFEVFVFDLILQYSGAGSVTGPSKIYGGDSVNVTVSPDSGHGIGSVTDNGVDVTAQVSGGTYVISPVSGDHTIFVEFEPHSSGDTPGKRCLPWLILIIIISIEICLAYIIGVRGRRGRQE